MLFKGHLLQMRIRKKVIVGAFVALIPSCDTQPTKEPPSQLQSFSTAPQSARKGTLRLVKPNDWACLAWTIADIPQPNSILDDILKKEPSKIEGSHLISIKSSQFFTDYSNDPVTAGKGYNGVWGDCPGFQVSPSESGSLQIRSSHVYLATPEDGNGQRVIAYETKSPSCATAVNGRVHMMDCDPQKSEQQWLWDAGKNGGYGYIKWAKDPSLCMDVTGGGAGVSQGRPINLHKCKLFVAGPGGVSNNQRFWLDETQGH